MLELGVGDLLVAPYQDVACHEGVKLLQRVQTIFSVALADLREDVAKTLIFPTQAKSHTPTSCTAASIQTLCTPSSLLATLGHRSVLDLMYIDCTCVLYINCAVAVAVTPHPHAHSYSLLAVEIRSRIGPPSLLPVRRGGDLSASLLGV